MLSCIRVNKPTVPAWQRLWLVLLLASAAAHVQAAAIPVVTGNTIVQDITVHIGGKRIDCRCLLRQGVDPHAYQPVAADLKRLAKARLVIINGMGFEGWFDGLAKEAKLPGLIRTASHGVQALTLTGEAAQVAILHQHNHGLPKTDKDSGKQSVVDPHAYMAIRNGIRYAENIRDALVEVDPAGAGIYHDNCDRLIVAMEQADTWAQQQLAGLARQSRVLVTDHDGLRYFAKAYGFRIDAPMSLLTAKEPSAKQVKELVDRIRLHKIRGIFLEKGRNPKLITQIAQSAGVRLGGTLYVDELGPVGSAAENYIGMFRHNVATICAALKEAD